MILSNKYKRLVKGVFFDGIGMLTMGIPVIGPFLDIVWAPYAAKTMTEMYPGKKGKVASILLFVEEILPYTDIIPSFTIMWVYVYIFNRVDLKDEIIEVEVV